MKAKYLNLNQTPNQSLNQNLPVTQRDLQNAENKKIASIQEAKDPHKDLTSESDQSRPNLNQSRPMAVQTPKLDGQNAVQKTVGVQEKLDGQKYLDAQFKSRQERTKLTVRLPNYKINKYKDFAFRNKLDMQELIEFALDKVLDGQITLDGQEKLDSQIGRPNADRSDRSDLKDIDRSLDVQKLNEVLDFYKYWTGNQITPKDESSYETIEHFDLIDIKIGILQAVKYSKEPVRIFNYCAKAILSNAKGKKPKYKYDKQQQLKDLIYELEKKQEQ